jgi:hypothetical protein
MEQAGLQKVWAFWLTEPRSRGNSTRRKREMLEVVQGREVSMR